MDFTDFIKKTEVTENQVAIFYIGQVGFILKNKDVCIAIDPYLSDYVDKNCCSEFVKWKRLYPPVVSPQELASGIDYVFCTHGHYDHADPWTLSVLAKNDRIKFIAPAPLKNAFLSYGVRENNFIGATQDKELTFSGFSVTPIPAAHDVIHYEDGVCPEMGFIFSIADMKIYHAGDTYVYDGLTERIENSDAAFIPVNGNDCFRTSNDIIGNTNADEALLLAKAAKVKLLIPTHFDLYAVNRISAAEFVSAHERISPKQQYHIFIPAERLIISK